MFRVPDHVHVKDAALVEAVDSPFRWDTDCADEEFRAAFDDDLDELAEFAVRVVIADMC
jgi:hypothetical protein